MYKIETLNTDGKVISREKSWDRVQAIKIARAWAYRGDVRVYKQRGIKKELVNSYTHTE
tara:strand:+ start:361 stop:537 length:177 start_codon:yes stop_codon:yes gene_type:complete